MDKKEKYNVLVVEDHTINQELMSEMLATLDCTVHMADNGKVALEKFESNSFDIIFMDVQMPEMDGLEATREIRKKKIETPIIALTANHLSGNMQRCYEAGMDGFLTKPFEVQDIEAIFDKFFPVSSRFYLSR